MAKVQFRNAEVVNLGDTDGLQFALALDTLTESVCLAFDSNEIKMEWYQDLKVAINSVKQAASKVMQAKEKVAKSKAEQTKAILGQKYVALRMETNNRDPNNRFASARRAKELAMQKG
jgi:hypothetical protein